MVQDKIYPMLSALVVCSVIFLWPFEFGPSHYDVGANVYLAMFSFVIYFPYIIRNFDSFPFVFSFIFAFYQIIWTLINGFDVRSTLTCVIFILYFYSIYYSLIFCFKDRFFLLKIMILFFLIVQLLFQLLDIIDVFHIYDFNTVRQYIFGSIGSTGFYGEGSHVAISLVPLLFIKDSRGSHFNVYTILVGLSLCLGISSTAVLGIFLLFVLLILRVNSWRKIALAASVVAGLLAIVMVGWQVFDFGLFSRLGLRIWGVLQIVGGEIQPGVSLSALVYANGVNMAWSGLKDIQGSGLGHFDIYFNDSIARAAIDAVAHGPLNKDDGSCVLLKMIGEMGLLGLVIVLYFVLNSVAIINKYGDSFLSVIACFLIMAAIRSAGYFHGPYILSFALVGVLWQMRGVGPGGPFNRQSSLNNTMPYTRALGSM